MNQHRSAVRRINLLGFAGFVLAALAGCSGDDGAPGPAGPSGVASVHASTATALNMTITGVTVASPPVVTFSVTDQNGMPVNGLRLGTDVRFTIAKLVPGSGGNSSAWQSYVNQASGGRVIAATEGNSPFVGTLVDNRDGTYRYTFATDITNASCPAPCTDSYGNALNVSYDANLTHRVGIQTRSTVPIVNAVHTFRPADGATSGLFSREIVRTEKCNECHNKLAVHSGARVETRLCVTCHNPGTTANGTVGTVTGNTPVDFKVMIHKLHMGEELPSVRGADGTFGTADDGSYRLIGGSGTVHDYSAVVFPMSGPSKTVGELRHCTKCHDAADTATPQASNWYQVPTKEACGSCHDDVNFTTGANHTGGAQASNSTCVGCHSTGGQAGPVETSHALPGLATTESAKYRFNILTVTNTGPTQFPIITFSITDPTNADAKYDLKTDTRLSAGSLTLAIAWNTVDLNNTGSTRNPGQPVTVSLVGTGAANAVDNGDRTYTVNLQTAASVNGSRSVPAGLTGSGRVAMYGRAAVDVDGNGTVDRVRVRAAFKDFIITGTSVVARRQVVDIAKCDKCHDQLSLHGDSRTDEPGLCVICHNPSATDANQRPKIVGGADSGFPNAAVTPDGKREEAIDFKRMIHAIHAGAKTDYTGKAAYGVRQKGIVVYGFGGTAFDFSKVRFPGILNDCSTCHTTTTVDGTTFGTYELVGIWQVPTTSGVLGSSILAAPTLPSAGGAAFATQLGDQTDDLNITPTAGVCSACHDSPTAQSHMQLNGALFSATQATINTGAVLEACAICHAPGRLADVKVVHGAK
jgi:OmcA/MtrC family decaheme c-type cytochrome